MRAPDALFVPSNWLHTVRNPTPSLMVNFWLRDASGARLFFPQRVTGSLGFFAPEMLHPEGYDGPPADVWSAGVLALEVLIIA